LSFLYSDLSDIPSQLRQVLETCLARDASPRVLEIYLPKVREIVINLLQGLKRKQTRYRARTTDPAVPEEDKRPSTTAGISATATTTRQRSTDMKEPPSKEPLPPQIEPRRQSPARRPVGAREESLERRTRRDQTSTTPNTTTTTVDRTSPQPPPPRSPSPTLQPPTNEALQKLQTSDALQRRASKRYSAYNFAKLDGLESDSGTGGTGRNVPPVPTRRSGSYSPEMGRSPKLRERSPRRRSPERRPVQESVPEEDESTSHPVVKEI